MPHTQDRTCCITSLINQCPTLCSAVRSVDFSLLENCYQVKRRLRLILYQNIFMLVEFSSAIVTKTLKEAVADSTWVQSKIAARHGLCFMCSVRNNKQVRCLKALKLPQLTRNTQKQHNRETRKKHENKQIYILYYILYILLYYIYYIIYIILYYRVDLLTKESQPDCIHVDHNRIDDPTFKIFFVPLLSLYVCACVVLYVCISTSHYHDNHNNKERI